MQPDMPEFLKSFLGRILPPGTQIDFAQALPDGTGFILGGVPSEEHNCDDHRAVSLGKITDSEIFRAQQLTVIESEIANELKKLEILKTRHRLASMELLMEVKERLGVPLDTDIQVNKNDFFAITSADIAAKHNLPFEELK